MIDGALALVQNINGYRFKWKENGNSSIGVSAQNIEKILPELVSDNGKTKTVNYNGLIGILIEAIKELSRKIENK